MIVSIFTIDYCSVLEHSRYIDIPVEIPLSDWLLNRSFTDHSILIHTHRHVHAAFNGTKFNNTLCYPNS